MSVRELAWAAGFFDGEGYAGHSGRSLMMAIGQSGSMITLRRFKRAIGGLGHLYGPYRRGDTRKLVYRWQTRGAGEVKHVISLLYPLLSSPKRRQIKGAIRSWQNR